MAVWRGWQVMLVLCLISLTTTASSECQCHPCKPQHNGHGLYDVTTIYSFDDLAFVTNPECSQNEYLCGDGTCITKDALCDGTRNCPDGSDENCISKDRVCGAGLFLCDDGRCVSLNYRCDGDNDCRSNSWEEEQDCGNRGWSAGCSSGQFSCNFGVCISESLQCNGVRDCSNGQDEHGCHPREFLQNRTKEASVEVRARTNALGLPVALTSGSTANVSDNEMDIFSWSLGSKTTWTIENWNISTRPFLDSARSEALLELTDEEGTLRSRTFSPSFLKMCVAVESSITPDSKSSLELHVEKLLSSDKFSIGAIDSHQVQGSNELCFSKHRYLVDIPEEFQNESLQIVVRAKKSSEAYLFIHKIYGCNIYDRADVAVLPKRYVSTKYMLPAYTVTDQYTIAAKPGTSNDCLNGGWFNVGMTTCQCPAGFSGVWCEKGLPKTCLHGGSYDSNVDACRCPVGFVGELCEQGCGPNRYGDDCGGVCSSSFGECKNMILCRPGLNCECAPGIKGDFCDLGCSEGEYGAGCKEICGHCNMPPCDSYTGLCRQGCQPGFYPPFCKTKYKQLTFAPELTAISYNSISVSVRLDEGNIRGEGQPLFYQLQYKLQGDTDWKGKEPHNMPDSSSQVYKRATPMTVTNLLGGRTYYIRVVLIDKDGESYQSEDVNSTVAETPCTVPLDVDYNLCISDIMKHSFEVNWNLTMMDAAWCPVTHFEVHVNDATRRTIYEVRQPGTQKFVVTGKLPGRTFYVKVRGMRTDGAAAFSPQLAVTTSMSEPGEVRNLRVVSAGSTELWIQWDRPWISATDYETYNVEFECRRLLSCRHEVCSSSARKEVVQGTSLVLEDLNPHAQYMVTVTAVLDEAGPATTIFAATNHSVPSIAPEPSPHPVSQLTNTSFTLQWNPPSDCNGFNSYLHGYRYELRLGSSTVFEGRTEQTIAKFSDLEPHSEYEARVFLFTSAGWNSDIFLLQFATTRATVPSAVMQLAVYKRSRRLVALRWSAPEHVYGELQSFRVSHGLSVGEQETLRSRVIPPKPCVAWPESFCYTVTGLSPDSNYTFTVQARNSEIDEDGEPATIVTVTHEGGAPWVPVGLRLVNRTHVSIGVAWQLPRMLNGVLRSFVINIEEESYNSSECCQYYPLQELPVMADHSSYFKEFTDLKPSTKYIISVTGKTISLGPSALLSATTPADTSTPPQPPEVASSFQYGSAIPVTLHPSKADSDLPSVYLVLVVPRGQKVDLPHTGVFDPALAELLDDAVESMYYIAAEMLPELLQRSRQVSIGTGQPAADGSMTRTEDPTLNRGEYSIGLAAVLDNSTSYSVSYIQSHPFTIV